MQICNTIRTHAKIYKYVDVICICVYTYTHKYAHISIHPYTHIYMTSLYSYGIFRKILSSTTATIHSCWQSQMLHWNSLQISAPDSWPIHVPDPTLDGRCRERNGKEEVYTEGGRKCKGRKRNPFEDSLLWRFLPAIKVARYPRSVLSFSFSSACT